jgi:ankyrin repeat protein
VVARLLAHGADPNVRDEGDAATPLHFAAEKQRLGVIRLLVERGADPDGDGDAHKLGVLGWATAFDNVQPRRDVIDYLLGRGARHSIFSAVAIGDVAAIRALGRDHVERRMDIANRRRTPLHLAVTKRQPAALEALLALGAQLELVDDRGLTPLDQAALEASASWRAA